MAGENHEKSVSQYKKAAISYIAGYVGKKVTESTHCTECGITLSSVSERASSSFLVLKDHGNLFKPTLSVIKVCEETEKCFQRMLALTDGQLPHAHGIPDAFVVAVLASLSISSRSFY